MFCFERVLGALDLAAIVISVGLAVVAFVASAVVLLLGVRFIEYAVGECVAKRCDLRLVTTDREFRACLLYTSPSPRDGLLSRMPSSA